VDDAAEVRKPSRDKSGGNPTAAAVALIAGACCMLPLLYVLSLGPALWLARRFPGLRSPCEVIYTPLQWLYDNTPLRAALDWYINLWQ